MHDPKKKGWLRYLANWGKIILRNLKKNLKFLNFYNLFRIKKQAKMKAVIVKKLRNNKVWLKTSRGL